MLNLIASCFYDICVLAAIALASIAVYNAIAAAIAGWIGILVAMLAALGTGLCTAYAIEISEGGFTAVKQRVMRLMDQGWTLVTKPTLHVVRNPHGDC